MDDANEADVDKLYIEEDNLSTSDGTIVEFDDAGIFSIANDYTSEDEDILAKDESDLWAVRNRSIETEKVSQQKNVY